MQRQRHTARTLALDVVLLPVHAYRRLISPLIGPRCRYHPTCSAYAIEAIRTYGPLRGFVLAVWRVLRCNPFSDGGFDAVSEQRIFGGRQTDSNGCSHSDSAVTR